jgi:acetyl esterase/lipase
MPTTVSSPTTAGDPSRLASQSLHSSRRGTIMTVRTTGGTLGACVALAAGLLSARAAPAQDVLSAMQACRDDYRRLCSGVAPGGGAIRACLREHAAELSPQCQDAAMQLRARLGEGATAEDAGAAVAVPDGVAVTRGVAYGPSPAQRMDVYRPAAARGAPVLLLVHGGAWMAGDKSNTNVVATKVAHWVPRGAVVVSANYRLLPEADPLAQADDVARALAAAQAKAAGWGGDAARFVLIGHSAGAHLVALLAADPAIARRRGARPWLGTVALDSAAFDVGRIMRQPHLPLYDRAFGGDPQYWHKASPLHRLTAVPAPMLLVCSTNRAVACAQAEGFASAVTARGGRATVLPVAMTHAAINRDLGLPGSYTAAVESFLRSVGLP